jgi:hypothetical protein
VRVEVLADLADVHPGQQGDRLDVPEVDLEANADREAVVDEGVPRQDPVPGPVPGEEGDRADPADLDERAR